MNELLTYQEAAAVYGLTYQTIRNWVNQSRLVPIQTAQGPRLSHEEMERYNAGLKKTGRPRKNKPENAPSPNVAHLIMIKKQIIKERKVLKDRLSEVNKAIHANQLHAR